ncbi:MAG TPA: hypothetical protein VFM53_06330 [Anaeromyxobacteraceae bacterium]|nr:hypothetical protein [Anaeromyxobacteraceae bacterium]
MRRIAAAVLSSALLASCVPPSILPADGRESVAKALARQPRYLRVAVYVGPFFGDGSRVLISDRPVSELAVLEAPDGKPILPPPSTRILPPGTPVFVDQVQFPTGMVILSRPLTTPRYNPWLLATVEGVPQPAVLLLSAESRTAEDVLAEVGRVLTPDDPTAVFAALNDSWRDAIREKAVVEGMTREAAAMAWGFPDRIVMDRPNRTEEWSWEGSTRKASFHDDRLVRKNTANGKPAADAR